MLLQGKEQWAMIYKDASVVLKILELPLSYWVSAVNWLNCLVFIKMPRHFYLEKKLGHGIKNLKYCTVQ